MPPSKKLNGGAGPGDDSRSDVSITRERQIAAAAHARKSKAQQQQHQQQQQHGGHVNGGGSGLKEMALTSTENGNGVGGEHTLGGGGGGSSGMNWMSETLPILNTYRVAHALPTPPSFTSCLHQARLTNSPLGRQSPTMARRREKRRVSKDQLALAVRKHFNGAAVSEIDVVVELVYKVKHQDRAFRMKSAGGKKG